jgi:5-bromo-4-chloroindolyl phosphate hydrolysis protein
METITIDKSLLDIMQSSMKEVQRVQEESARQLTRANEAVLAATHAIRILNENLEEAHAKIQTLETMMRAKK